MKKILVLFFSLFLMFFSISANAEIVENNVVNKISPFGFIAKAIVEKTIEFELKKEFDSKFKADLTVESFNKLKNGEFKSLILKSNNVKYDALSVTDFTANTKQIKNKIIYKNKRVYFPIEIPFDFNGVITNDDINFALNSARFKKQLEKASVKVSGKKLFSFDIPKIELKDNLMYCTLPVKSLLFKNSLNLNFNADVEVENNKILLKNITFTQKSNIINSEVLVSLLANSNPISFELTKTNSKYCKIDLSKAKIIGDKIDLSGTFTLNKNYSEE